MSASRLTAAWDAGDAAAYGGLFTDDATYVIFLGELLSGRAEIERKHVDVLGRWQKGSKMIVKPLSVRDIGSDARILVTVGGIGAVAPITYDKLQTFTLVRHGDGWLCAAFQNTAMSDEARQLYNRSDAVDVSDYAS